MCLGGEDFHKVPEEKQKLSDIMKVLLTLQMISIKCSHRNWLQQPERSCQL
jgi:hypothetical protein